MRNEEDLAIRSHFMAGCQIVTDQTYAIVINTMSDYEYRLKSKKFNYNWLWSVLAGIACFLAAPGIVLLVFLIGAGEMSIICSAYPAAMLLILGVTIIRGEDFWDKKYEYVQVEKK